MIALHQLIATTWPLFAAPAMPAEAVCRLRSRWYSDCL